MPIIVAFLIRQIIIIGTQIAIFEILDNYVIPLINKGIAAIVEAFGVSEETATDILSNEILRYGESILGAAFLAKLRLPTKIADKLGFTTKGYKVRKLPAEVEAKVSGKTIAVVKTAEEINAGIKASAEVLATQKKVPFATAYKIYNEIFKILGLTVATTLAVANVVDFGAWDSSSYQGFFQNLLSKFGIEKDKDVSHPKSISVDMFNKLFTALKAEGITEFTDPYDLKVYPLTRDNLINTSDKVAGQINFEKGATSFKDLIAVFATIVRKGKTVSTAPVTQTVLVGQSTGAQTLSSYYASIGQNLPSIAERAKQYENLGLGQASYYTGTAEQNTRLLNALKGNLGQNQKGVYQLEKSDVPGGTELIYYPPGMTPNPALRVDTQSSAGKITNAPVVPPPPTQVFMGVVASGTLSNQVTFTERPNDIIESIDELESAARNNLSAFLMALPNRISYELKIVTSVVTAGGFRQTGTTSRYITGYDSKGVAKYKSVTNKFATLQIFVLSDKGTRTKLGDIILGPTDASRLAPTQTDLRQLEALIQGTVISKNVDDINAIKTSTPVTIVPPSVENNTLPSNAYHFSKRYTGAEDFIKFAEGQGWSKERIAQEMGNWYVYDRDNFTEDTPTVKGSLPTDGIEK